jgi:aspartate/methionine/tyrosine aminotransferase
MNKNIDLMENENAFKVLSRAQKLEETGEKIINLGIGQPDLTPPKYVIEEAINALKNENHGYSNAKGMLKLRETISNEYQSLYKQNIDPDNIIVSPGAKPIIYMAISMLSECNCEILLSNPSFPIYSSVIKYCGAKPVYFDLKEENNFDFIADDIIAKITDKTKLIILNSPCNPTGSVIKTKELKKLLNFIENLPYKVFILSDEIYSKIIFNPNIPTSVLQYSNNLENLIIINGLSKSFSMTGWRIGWGIFPPCLINNAEKYAVNIFSCVNNFTQFAAISALVKDFNYTENLKNIFNSRVSLMVKGINQINGFQCNFPSGSFYCFVNIKNTNLSSSEVQDILLEKLGIATIDGNNFGSNNGYLRISCCTSEENIKIALEKIGNYFN